MLHVIHDAVLAHRNRRYDPSKPIQFINDLAAGDRRFITTLAAELNLAVAWDEFNNLEQNVVSLYFQASTPMSIGAQDGGNDDSQWEDTDDSDDVDEQESNIAVDRVLNRYLQARAVDGDDEEDFDAREAKRLKERMDEWKRNYYKVTFASVFLR